MKHHWSENETTPDGIDDGGTGDRPDFLLEKFADAEAQAKAYAEAEKEMQRMRSQLDEERAQFASALERIESVQQAPPAPVTGVDPQTSQLLAQYQQAVDNQDAAAQLAITLGLQQQMMDQALEARFAKLEPQLGQQSKADRDIAFEIAQDRVGKQFGDQWDELQPEVQRWLNEHQSYLPTTNSPEAFEIVIREGAQTIVNQKAAERLAALEADRAAKLGAQTAAGAGQGRYPIATSEKQQAWDEVRAADVGSYSERMAGRGGN